MTDAAFAAFAESTVRTATPLALAALGETLTERSGVINIGLEGAIIAGALAAAFTAVGVGPIAGLAAAAVAGAGVAAVFVIFAVGLRADQIITGAAVTMAALGLTSALYRVLFGEAGAALGIPTLPALAVPVLADIPGIGAAFFRQPVTTYLAYGFAPLATWFLFRTSAGLALRAAGEAPAAAYSVGVSPQRLQALATIVGGAMGGLAGASLVLAHVGTFAEGLSAGRGFIAIAIVALGRWHPAGALLASLLFGAASALQYLLQATASALPYQLFLALPYVLALGTLATGAGRARAPAALGTSTRTLPTG